jgi:hypothetical protein
MARCGSGIAADPSATTAEGTAPTEGFAADDAVVESAAPSLTRDALHRSRLGDDRDCPLSPSTAGTATGCPHATACPWPCWPHWVHIQNLYEVQNRRPQRGHVRHMQHSFPVCGPGAQITEYEDLGGIRQLHLRTSAVPALASALAPSQPGPGQPTVATPRLRSPGHTTTAACG